MYVACCILQQVHAACLNPPCSKAAGLDHPLTKATNSRPNRVSALYAVCLQFTLCFRWQAHRLKDESFSGVYVLHNAISSEEAALWLSKLTKLRRQQPHQRKSGEFQVQSMIQKADLIFVAQTIKMPKNFPDGAGSWFGNDRY